MDQVKIQMNWYDKLVGFFSPRAAAHRTKYRLYNSFLTRKYEGADAGRRTAGWITSGKSANAETSMGIIKLRDRARDLVRNNPYAKKGIQVIANNVVGKGIVTQIKIDKKSKLSTAEKRVNSIWRAWANTTAIDFEETQNIFGIQRLVMRSIVESGEVLIRKRVTKRREQLGPDGIVWEIPPLQLQVLESDFIASTRTVARLENGNQINQGIEIDSQGRRVAYHLFQDHPGSLSLIPSSKFNTVRVPVDEILHLYLIDRPGQLRGVTWFDAVMIKLRDFDIFEDAQLKRQQCAAMFVAFVHDIEGLDDATEVKTEKELGEKMEPGLIEILPPGKSITLAKPPGAENYEEYTSVVLRAISSGLGITVESLTNNLKDVNFSAGRIGFLEMQRNIETWRSLLMLSRFMNPTFTWFRNSMELIGEDVPNMRAVHTPPKREMIDPVKETEATKTAIRSGLKTLSTAIREAGEDPDLHFEELKRDNETLDRLDLTLDTDARKGQNENKTPTQDKK